MEKQDKESNLDQTEEIIVENQQNWDRPVIIIGLTLNCEKNLDFKNRQTIKAYTALSGVSKMRRTDLSNFYWKKARYFY